jgi:hypothetical protein
MYDINGRAQPVRRRSSPRELLHRTRDRRASRRLDRPVLWKWRICLTSSASHQPGSLCQAAAYPLDPLTMLCGRITSIAAHRWIHVLGAVEQEAHGDGKYYAA